MGSEGRFRTSVVVVGCLQCPGCWSAPQILRVRQPAEKSTLAGRKQTEHEALPGGQGGRGGLTRGGHRGISGWQLVKRYCGEIGGQGL